MRIMKERDWKKGPLRLLSLWLWQANQENVSPCRINQTPFWRCSSSIYKWCPTDECEKRVPSRLRLLWFKLHKGCLASVDTTSLDSNTHGVIWIQKSNTNERLTQGDYFLLHVSTCVVLTLPKLNPGFYLILTPLPLN